jgi:predicted DNA-binding transcriptional regulator AlpA
MYLLRERKALQRNSSGGLANMEIDIHNSDFRLWNISEVAACLGVSAKFIEKLRTAGDFIPAIVIGRCVRWDPSAVQAYAHSLTEKAAAA